MRTVVALGLLVMIAGTAAAQEPKLLKTLRIHQPPTGATELYIVDDDGTVRTDWDNVEALAASKADRIALPTAQVMLAIRDRTLKSMR